MTKSVVITGANSGIGKATALELAGAGYDVIGTARSEAKAGLLRVEAEARSVAVRTVVLDVADAESTEKGLAEIATMTDAGPGRSSTTPDSPGAEPSRTSTTRLRATSSR